MVPLLVKGLKEETSIKRKCCVIITNMTKLVHSPAAAHKFLPKLQPGVEKVARTASDPELRDVAGAAMALLERVAADSSGAVEELAAAAVDSAVVMQALTSSVASTTEVPPPPPCVMNHIAALSCAQIDRANYAGEL